MARCRLPTWLCSNWLRGYWLSSYLLRAGYLATGYLATGYVATWLHGYLATSLRGYMATWQRTISMTTLVPDYQEGVRSATINGDLTMQERQRRRQPQSMLKGLERGVAVTVYVVVNFLYDRVTFTKKNTREIFFKIKKQFFVK